MKKSNKTIIKIVIALVVIVGISIPTILYGIPALSFARGIDGVYQTDIYIDEYNCDKFEKIIGTVQEIDEYGISEQNFFMYHLINDDINEMTVTVKYAFLRGSNDYEIYVSNSINGEEQLLGTFQYIKEGPFSYQIYNITTEKNDIALYDATHHGLFGPDNYSYLYKY